MVRALNGYTPTVTDISDDALGRARDGNRKDRP
jgi:hypothetical protein